jgi:uncharacterized repeat protein (TIGR01451 family)
VVIAGALAVAGTLTSTTLSVSGGQEPAAQAPQIQRGARQGPLSQVRVFTGSLTSLPEAREWRPGDPTQEVDRSEMAGTAPARLGAEYPTGLGAIQSAMTGTLEVTPPSFSTPNPNFDGIAFTGFTPPDTNGDVGPNHYVQAVNAHFRVFDKTGNALTGTLAINSLFTGFGGFCENNNRGDPIVNYDHLADRWLISQFTGLQGQTEFHQCFAISRGPDPVNDGWYLYDFLMFDTDDFRNDYPKIGVWPDGYYMGTQRGFPGGDLDVFAFDRASMLNGNPATFQHFVSPGNPALFLLPADLDGPAPAMGTPAPFIRHVDGGLWGGNDRLEIFEFSVDWGVPANSTFGGPTALNVAPFSADCGGGGGLTQACVTQPGTAQTVESLAAWMLWRLQYRNFGTHETMVVNHSVDVDGNDHAGVRWYELRRNGGAWSIFQQATFSPDAGAPGLADDPHRFMGSIAMDGQGNIALGYSASSTTVFPEVRYSGRLATDPLGLLPHGEVTMVAGTGSQVGSTRWGDYSSMSIDPVDGCTFWYTQEYMPASGNWRTRIGAFRFSSCNQADLRITKTASPSPATAGAPLFYSVTVTNDGPSPANNVVVVDTLPAGVTYVADTDTCVQGPVGTLTCSLGTIASGASKNFTIQVMVDADLVSTNGGPLSITNTATVSADEEDPDPTDNSASVTTLVGDLADLFLTKQCKPDGPIVAGGTATCTIFVTNLGPSDARNVVVTDVLLSNGPFTITSATFDPPPGSPCGIAGGIVTCNLGTEPAGGTTTITVTVTSSEGVDVNDTASVTSTTPDPDLDNNQDTGQIHFTGLSDLTIQKTDTPDPVIAGTNLTYQITVSNTGPSSAPNVVVKDTIPGQTAVLSATPSQGSCQNGIPGDPLQPLTCTLGTIAVSGNATIDVVVKVDPATPNGTVINNNASVASANADNDNSDNSVSATTTVLAQADLVIVKTSDQPNYKPSSVVTYTVSVTNTGPSNALAVVVTDTLPPLSNQTVYQSDTGGCTLSGSILTCVIGDMAVGENRSFNISLLVKGNQGAVSNTASVASSTTDPNLVNNSSTLVVQVKK